MKVIKVSSSYRKPKNYSRKSLICSCDCPVMYNEEEPRIHLDNIKVKYSVKTIKHSKYTSTKNTYTKGRWGTTYSHWGEFDDVVELPEMFSKLNDDEFSVKLSEFTRDNRQMPYICEIEVYNMKKYKTLKIQEQRSKKLKNIMK